MALMKKLVFSLFFLFVLLFAAAPAHISFAATLPQQVRVVHNSARIFSQEILNQTDIQGLNKEQLDQLTIKLALLGDVFDTVEMQDDFYKINFKNEDEQLKSGYIFKAVVIDNAIKSPEIFLQTNASTTSECEIYTFENQQYHKVENIVLPQGTPVRLQQKLSAKNQFTLVSFMFNNQRYDAFVKSENLKQDGVSRSVLTAITLTFVSISVGSALLAIFKRNNKKTKTTKNTTI